MVSPSRVAPFRVDDVVALSPFRDEVRNQLRGVLQVAVDHDHGVTRGRLQARQGRHRLAEASGKAQQLHARVLVAELPDELPRCRRSRDRR